MDTSIAAQLKFQIVFSVIVVAVALLFTWLIMGESSPFADYFVWHGDLPNLWAMTTLIPYIVGAVFTGNPHSPHIVPVVLALIVQWFVIGLLLSIPVWRLRVYMNKNKSS